MAGLGEGGEAKRGAPPRGSYGVLASLLAPPAVRDWASEKAEVDWPKEMDGVPGDCEGG